MQSKKFSWKARVRSFDFAFSGVKSFFRWEHNAWIHAFAAVVAIIAAIILKLNRLEMVAIIVAIGMVVVAEMFNTAIEKIMNHLSPEIHPDVKAIKDISAAAVLVAALLALAIGLIIFIPKFL